MSQQPEALYLGLLLIFLVLMRSPWPWTRGGGIFLATLGLSSLGMIFWQRPTVLDEALHAGRLLPNMLALLVSLIVWWSLYSARQPAAHQTSSWARFAGIACGVLALTWLASSVGAPRLETAPDTPWFLAGLEALAGLTGATFGWVVVPVVALIGLLLAPELDAHDADNSQGAGPASSVDGTATFDSRALIDGRRDELPFFLFAWLAVGVLPIVLVAWRPDFGTAIASDLAQRFWLDWLGMPVPGLWLLRELPGLVLYAALFIGLPVRLPKWKASKGVFGRHLRRLGPARYGLLMTLTGLLALVPVKVAFHFLLGIGAWVVLGSVEL